MQTPVSTPGGSPASLRAHYPLLIARVGIARARLPPIPASHLHSDPACPAPRTVRRVPICARHCATCASFGAPCAIPDRPRSSRPRQLGTSSARDLDSPSSPPQLAASGRTCTAHSPARPRVVHRLMCTRSSRYIVCRLTRMPSSVPEGSEAVGSATLEAARSSNPGSGPAPPIGSVEPPRAARRVLP